MRDRFNALRPLDALLPLLALILLWPIVAHYERPVQDRDFGSLGGGSGDFASYYLGSVAYVRGFDPYLNGRPEFRDPYGRPEFREAWFPDPSSGGIKNDRLVVGQYYLPGHFLAFAPLAWIYGEDWEEASRAYIRVHAALLVLLSWIVAWGARGKTARGDAWDHGRMWQLWAFTMILLGLQVGVRLGLERGQSDVIQSVLFWGGVASAARGQMAIAALLIVAGTSLKGYGAILMVGLGLSLFGNRDFRAFVLGGLAAGLPILGLTWPFVFTGIRVALRQSEDFSFHWMNHSFKHIGWSIGPSFADPIRYLLSLVALATAVVWWKRYRAERAANPQASTRPLVIAATASIAAMLGFSASSSPYNLVLLLPGLVWIGELIRTAMPANPAQREFLFATAFFLIVLDQTPMRQFAPASYGLVLLVAWCGWEARSGTPGGRSPREAPVSVSLPIHSQGD